MYKLCVYIPESHLEQVKAALFAAGAGKIGNYDSCCWQILGQGQFRALEGSQPYIGQAPLGKDSKVETVNEYKVEMVCEDKVISAVVSALKDSHPYEEPAYDAWQLADI